MKNIENVSIKIKTGVYGQFRNLNNKIWFALGEFVDNAVQSYENNKVELISNSKGNYQFVVKIDIDWERNVIKIFDNAAGINAQNIQRAFEPANIPIDNSGLHEFGMGMKTASIWLADHWSVRTAALGESIERLVEFDLKEVLDKENEILNVVNKKKESNLHYTEVILSQLSSNAPSIMQMDKIKRHLASIYRKFIRSGDLMLIINDDVLSYDEPEILKAPYFNDPNGKVIEWKKEINFIGGKYKVSGFIAVLSKMSTSEINGLSLFRRGRVIEGSHDEKYRPKVLCGQTGSPRYKRIFGELELEGFNVSFNKGSFQEQEDLGALMDALQFEISSKEFDLYNQAEKYIKPKEKEDDIKVAKNIVNILKKSKSSLSLKDKVNTSIKDIENNEITSQNEKLSQEAIIIDSIEETVEIKDEKFKLQFELITEKSITDLYSLQVKSDELFSKVIIYKINLAHPFFQRFEKLKNEEDYQPIISIIKSLVLAEVVAPNQGTKNGGNIRINFNRFLLNL